MKVAIHQPNYFPWLGYFAKMAQSDVFIFLDDAQLPQGRSYVHRTRIPADGGSVWMSAPVRRERLQAIGDVRFAEDGWRRRHRATLLHTYRHAPFFEPVMALVDTLFALETDNLSRFNMNAVSRLAGYLDLPCRCALASSFGVTSSSDDRLVDLVRAVEGAVYISGEGGQNYQHAEKFEAAGIELRVCSYKPRPYRQVQDGFVAGLSVLDALFNLGPDARHHLTYEPAREPQPSV
ncbi:WbqC family protein [Azospirillum doebereinerae]